MNFISAMIRFLGGETTPARIARKQSEIDTVVARNSNQIQEAITDELKTVMAVAASAIIRIDQLAEVAPIDHQVRSARQALSDAMSYVNAGLPA